MEMLKYKFKQRCQANTNMKRAGVTNLVPDEIYFRVIKHLKNKEYLCPAKAIIHNDRYR